ncbi:FAD-dependent oxidoreductase [Lunatibacter salilacus]|uniref:FAD-dependent oxidoreductase n=1 Tax=Lunatibacter salilacus TaxID=2483804 RepID=UPI00131D9940|nr:FAD-dependent oxidoreductase [Lunatibacter salilacus]
MKTPNKNLGTVWGRDSEQPVFNSLNGDLEADVAIIGGGITGISAAYLLSKAGLQVIVLEAAEVGKGTTGFSTGNLYAPIDSRLFSLDEKHGGDAVKEVVASRVAAIDFIEERVDEFGIECGFQRVPWHLFTTPVEDNGMGEILKEHRAALEAGLEVSTRVPADFPLSVTDIITIPGQAQFDPLVYTRELAANISSRHCQIFENTPVLDISDKDPCVLLTHNGTVRAKKVIMATHTPKGIYAVQAAMESKREFALAVRLKVPLPPPAIYWHATAGGQYSIRPYQSSEGDYLIVLGRSYTVGKNDQMKGSYQSLEKYIRSRFDVERIDHIWAAQNYRPADHLPYIGKSVGDNNIYIATGFAADGLVYGTTAALIISDLIQDKNNKWEQLYDPKRLTPVASAKTVIKENLHVGKELLKDYIFYDRNTELNQLKDGEGKLVTVDGEKVAAHRDGQGTLHLVSSICPHMGCIVHWNEVETSWDCPCHGSRFSIDGDVIEGPAYQGLAKPSK